MYDKNLSGRSGLTPEFEDGVKTFIKWAKCQHGHMDGDKIKCPFRKCKNTKFRIPDDEYFDAVTAPLVQEEQTPAAQEEVGPGLFFFLLHGVPDDGMRSCPIDAGPSLYYYGGDPYDYVSELVDQLYDVVHAVDQPFWNVKYCLNHTLPRDYYSTEKLIKDLGLPIEKIDTCKNDCMLYWKDDVYLEYCKFVEMLGTSRCGSETPLQEVPRLYATGAIAEHMMWHATYQMEEGSICHPFDAKARKHFDLMYPDFAEELRNVRLSLCTDGFATWAIRSYLFMLACYHHTRLIDMYLEPLIEELLQLWHVGVRTYDNTTDKAFNIQTALMWTVNDLPAYGIASGWSTTGIIGCPVCIDDTRAFHLQHSRKVCYFHCHGQFLFEDHPYQRNKKAFTKNRVEYKVARSRLTGEQICDWVAYISPIVEIPLTLLFGYSSDYK
ncbi:UNVERIFIED_CONTAM: hypothetical protein Sindi_0656000 [Sesamum indicum]